MQLLVGIPTHKRPELLRECLASIAAQEGALPDIAVLVADNDPADRQGANVVAELAPSFRFPMTFVIVEEPGVSAVRNAILEAARTKKSDLIAMIDDDETASPRWLVELLNVQRQTSADVVGGPVIRNMPESTPQWLREGIFRVPYDRSGAVTRLKGTGNVLVWCGAMERMGWPGFDPTFNLTGGEDLEWFTRLRRSGATFAWAALAETTELIPPDRATLAWMLKRSYRNGATQMRVARIHKDWLDLSRQLGKAAAIVGLSPFFALGLPSSRLRLGVLVKWAWAIGRLSALIGAQHYEYATRHGQAP